MYPNSFSKKESRWRWINARKRRDAFVCWSYMSTPWYRLQAVWAPWWILGSPISPPALLLLKPFFSSSRSISLSPALFLSPFLAALVSLSLSLSSGSSDSRRLAASPRFQREEEGRERKGTRELSRVKTSGLPSFSSRCVSAGFDLLKTHRERGPSFESNPHRFFVIWEPNIIRSLMPAERLSERCCVPYQFLTQ